MRLWEHIDRCRDWRENYTMSSKRRTFHVDWDSPSHETGTVRRRPASLNAFFSASSNGCVENVEYYELRDHIGGYGLRRLELTRFGSEDAIAAENVLRTKNEKSAVVKDNENCSGLSRSSRVLRKKDTLHDQNDDPEKFKASVRTKRVFTNEQGHSRSLDVGELRKDFRSKHSLTKNRKFYEVIKNESDKDPEDIEAARSQDLCSEKVGTRKDFDLRLFCEPFEWKSAACRVTKIRRSQSLKFRSLIPRPKLARSGRTHGLASSSSESSGFGSPLSPLSPQQDPSISKYISKDIIRSSDSKSSGLGSPGSPDSPLSPESQKYSAFHLIQLQLEKLRNCSCEDRQAEVNLKIRKIWNFQEIELHSKHSLGTQARQSYQNGYSTIICYTHINLFPFSLIFTIYQMYCIETLHCTLHFRKK